MEKLKVFFEKIKKNSVHLKWLIPALALFAFGIGAFIMYEAITNIVKDGIGWSVNLAYLRVWIGAGMMALGICEVFLFFKRPKELRSFITPICGAIAFALGVYVIFGFGLQVMEVVIPAAFAIWILASLAAPKLTDAYKMRREGKGLWVLNLIGGLFAIILAIALLLNDSIGAWLQVATIAIVFLAHGAYTVWQFFRRNKET